LCFQIQLAPLHEGNTFSGLVHRVKLEHLAGNPPTATVTILANAAEQPADLAPRQGLTLVHVSAQRKRFPWDRGCV